MNDEEDLETLAKAILALSFLEEISSILEMQGNYEDRLVANYASDDGKLYVDTCAVTDSQHPYETAIAHPSYNNGELIIVEMYDDYESAVTGHHKWLSMVIEDDLPHVIHDVSENNFIVMAEEIFGADTEWRDRKRNLWIDENDNEEWF